MSQEEYNEIQSILQKITKLEDELKTRGQEIDELKSRLDELILYGFAPINTHMYKWDKRDVYIHRAQRFIRRFIYTPIHFGFRATFVIIVKLSLTLFIGLIAGVLLNIVGVGNLIKNIIDFFSIFF